ncbi:MAG TPA: hypothetical protein VFP72_20740, partial [Kineosporiaceae bacterium]|nr:hypothetical protein [Kineosporiaceae bacterium]
MEGLPRQRTPEPGAGSGPTDTNVMDADLTDADLMDADLTDAGPTGAGSAAGPSPDPEGVAGQGVATRLTALQVIAGDEPRVRAIRFDQPLQEGAAARLGWADPEIEHRLERAAQQAREQAQSLGYAAGWAQGRQAAAERERLEAAEREVAAAQALQDERI